MFAFCPLTNQQMCGISSDQNKNNMIIYASATVQTISITNLRFYNVVPIN